MPRVLALEQGEQVFMPPGGDAQARRFYGQVLGMRETMRAPGEKGVWFSAPVFRSAETPDAAASGGIQAEDGVLKVTPQTAFEAVRDKPVAKLRVDSAEGLRAALERGRMRVWDAPHEVGTRGFYTADPFGNRVELRERPGA